MNNKATAVRAALLQHGTTLPTINCHRRRAIVQAVADACAVSEGTVYKRLAELRRDARNEALCVPPPRVRMIQHLSGIPDCALANALGVTEPHFAAMADAAVAIPVDLQQRLSELLRVDVADLFAGEAGYAFPAD